MTETKQSSPVAGGLDSFADWTSRSGGGTQPAGRRQSRRGRRVSPVRWVEPEPRRGGVDATVEEARGGGERRAGGGGRDRKAAPRSETGERSSTAAFRGKFSVCIPSCRGATARTGIIVIGSPVPPRPCPYLHTPSTPPIHNYFINLKGHLKTHTHKGSITAKQPCCLAAAAARQRASRAVSVWARCPHRYSHLRRSLQR